jgi:hypothetical protein
MRASGKHRIIDFLLPASLCLCVLGQPAPQTSRHSDIALLVHPDTPVESLSVGEVRKLFLGERQYWSAKLPVELYLRAPVSHERDVVLRIIYQMTESQYRQYWIAKILRAEAVSSPKTVSSNDAAIELVTAIPGAIVVVDARDVRPGPKMLRVDGHWPGEPGYPLR